MWFHLALIAHPPSRYVCRMQLSLKMREEFYVQFIGIKTTFLSSAYFTYGKVLFFVSSFFCCGRKQKILPNVERGAYSFEITLDAHGSGGSIRKLNRMVPRKNRSKLKFQKFLTSVNCVNTLKHLSRNPSASTSCRHIQCTLKVQLHVRTSHRQSIH